MFAQSVCIALITITIRVKGRTIPSYDIIPESEARETYVIEEPEKRPNNSSKDMCSDFTHYPGLMTIGGDALSKVGDGYSNEGCIDSCLQMREFVCTGALIQSSAICFLTGYRLRDDFYSVHYTRTCDLPGYRCYNKEPYTSAGFTHKREVPWFLGLSAGLAESYCMAFCDDDESCLGFDIITTQSKKMQCMYLNLFKVPADSFDFFTRRC